MKNIYRSFGFLLLLLVTIFSNAQTVLNGGYLNVNNVNALIQPVGNQFRDMQGNAQYEVPAGSGIKSIYNSTLWIGGLDSESNLHLSAEQYRYNGADYFTGPLTIDGTASTNQTVVDAWNRVWPVSRPQIEEFLLCNNNAEYPLYEIPAEILNWPGNGDVEAGQAQNLAPYIDINEDGIYNPEDGDYPHIPGDYAIFFIFNDNAEVHGETGGLAMGIEVHALAYAFVCNVGEAFQNTIFLKYSIINRSSLTYSDVYLGSFTDIDIGFGSDDYIGCDVVRGCYYGYNGDPVDESVEDVLGYGDAPPLQATVFLAGPKADADGIDNPTSYDTIDNVPVLNCARGDILNGNINGLNFEDGVVDNERLGMTGFMYFNCFGNPATLPPGNASEYYNYMKGIWLDNSPLIYGGTGHQSSIGADPNTPTSFMIPGNPTTDPCGWGQGAIPQCSWSEETEENPAGDSKGLGVSGPFTFESGDTVELDLAFVYGQSDSSPFEALEQLVQNVDVIRNGYLDNITPCGTPFYYSGINPNSNATDFSVSIFPNPANNNLTLELNSNKNSTIFVKTMDINGRVYLASEISANSGNTKTTIDISSLAAGVYFVAIDDGVVVTNKKLVVLR